MVNVKNGNIKRKICIEKRLNTSLKDFSLALTNHGRHGLFSFLSSLPISVLRNLELEVNKLYDRANKLYEYVFKRVSFGSKDCTKELKLECAYFLGQTS